MGSQVAVAEVAVVPTFKGFRKLVTNETDSSAKAGAQGFSRAFEKTGTTSGKQVGTGFKKAFEQSAQGTSDKVTKALEADVAKASRALSTARLREQDAIGKVRVAQAQLNEANSKYEKDSSQVIRAQERLATASRQLETAHEGTERATDDLKRSQGELARAADRAGDELAEAGDKGVRGFRANVLSGVAGFGVGLVGAFSALGIGNIVADAFTEAKDFVLSTISLASDLEQSIGGVDAVFGDQASQIHRWAEAADQAVGLSQSKYNEFATIVGAQLKNLGIPLDEVGDQTNLLIELGSDLAAQYGGPTSDAVSALSSLLRGERDPIERYGVTMNEASVKAEALSLGLLGVTQDADKVSAAQMRAELAQRKYNEAVEKYGENSDQALSANASLISANGALETALEGTTGELTNQQKAQATLSLLMKQTSDAQGAFARESETFAGKQARNTAAWENLTTQLGMDFLPIATQVADVIGKDIIPVISELAEEHGPDLAQAFADVLPELTELTEELLPLLPGLVASFADALPGLIGFLAALTPLLIATTEGGNDQVAMWSGLFSLLSGDSTFLELGQEILTLNGPIGDASRWVTDLGITVGTWFFNIGRDVSTGVNTAVAFITGLPGRALAAVGNLGNLLFSSGRALMDGFLDGIKSMIDDITSTVSGAIEWVMGFFPNSPAKRGPLSGSGWTKLGKSGEAFWDQWLGGMGNSGPDFPDFPPDFPSAPVTGGGGSSSPSAGGARTVNQYIYPQQLDSRIQMREWGREAGRAFAAMP